MNKQDEIETECILTQEIVITKQGDMVIVRRRCGHLYSPDKLVRYFSIEYHSRIYPGYQYKEVPVARIRFQAMDVVKFFNGRSISPDEDIELILKEAGLIQLGDKENNDDTKFKDNHEEICDEIAATVDIEVQKKLREDELAELIRQSENLTEELKRMQERLRDFT